ncbi:hypothetical protein E2C01_088699 [Portunus trituberculatus]|uniref:Uncharacterized protein n=1 Tax=Portunus trituberculatus TaxID=210409 RepID=A0A5B7JH70_PORTR|nr:hypothetical protein [Portunus trituberculatus]
MRSRHLSTRSQSMGEVDLKDIQYSLTVNKEINILMERRHNMERLQYSIQFCSSGRHVCREPPGNLSVSVEIGRDVVTDEQPTFGPAAID